MTATYVLGELAISPSMVVPALTRSLHSPNSTLRASASLALGHYATNAIAAVPQLRACFLDADTLVRLYATNALLKIAPEALTNAPAQ